jgi:predicted dehydrogenase
MSPSDSSFPRRRFVAGAGAVVAAGAAAGLFKTPVLGQSQAPASGRVLGANDRVVVGVIGMGGRGNTHAENYAAIPNVEVAYVCDVDATRLSAALQKLAGKEQAKNVRGVSDLRRILEDPRVDAISIAAPNHWHAIATIMGCRAGKHVYVEKPGSHNPREAELMVAVARDTGRLVQMGNQRRSFSHLMEAVQALREGVIGPVRFARAWYQNSRPGIGRGKTMSVPSSLDWALWQGPCPERAYKDNLHPYNWHWHWGYGGGELANNGVHSLDVVRWGLGVKYPQRVSYLGGRYHFDDDQESPDTGTAIFDFGHCGASWEHSSCHQRRGEKMAHVAFYGEKGTLLMHGGNDYTIVDPAGREVAKKSGGAGGGDAPHFRNFIAAVRGVEPLTSPIAEGQISTMLCHLGNIACRTGQVLQVNPESGRLVGAPAAATALWRREYRAGWDPNA